MLRYLLLALCLICGAGLLTAQKAKKEKEEIPDGWRAGAGIGLDLTQLLQINPKQGAGQNRIGFEGAFNGFANWKLGRRAWDNTFLWQFGLQRLGSGVISQMNTDRIPFQKTVDEFRFTSKYGYKIRPDGNLYYSANATFLSQLTPTYQFPDRFAGNFISDFIDSGRSPLSKFLAPATATFSLGLDYKPVPALSIFVSPVASKFVIVANDSIASRGIQGNPVEGQPNELGIYPEYDHIDPQIGALAQVQYKQAFLSEDRAVFTTNLGLYTNYLRKPENVDLDWQNSLAFSLTKNLQFTAFLNLFYDDDILVQITDYSEPNGVAGLGKRLSITQQILISYARTFE
jgi:hypothetical protein